MTLSQADETAQLSQGSILSRAGHDRRQEALQQVERQRQSPSRHPERRIEQSLML